MEVDIPQVNGFPVQPTFTAADAGGNHVQFNSVAEVKTYKVISHQEQQPQQQEAAQAPRPKHKARRRARVPKLDILQGEDAAINGKDMSKPLSPSKLKKMMDKDRHSRTGRRGLPKKGKQLFWHIYIHIYSNFREFLIIFLVVHGWEKEVYYICIFSFRSRESLCELLYYLNFQ